MNVKMEIKLEYADGKHITLTEAEARELYNSLGKKLGYVGEGRPYKEIESPIYEPLTVTYEDQHKTNVVSE